MQEDLIQLPDFEEVKEMLSVAREDIKEEVKQDPELATPCKLLTKVIDIIEEKISKKSASFSEKEKIDFAAHLNFLQLLLEDFFCVDDDLDFDEEDFEDEEEEDEE